MVLLAWLALVAGDDTVAKAYSPPPFRPSVGPVWLQKRWARERGWKLA